MISKFKFRNNVEYWQDTIAWCDRTINRHKNKMLPKVVGAQKIKNDAINNIAIIKQLLAASDIPSKLFFSFTQVQDYFGLTQSRRLFYDKFNRNWVSLCDGEILDFFLNVVHNDKYGIWLITDNDMHKMEFFYIQSKIKNDLAKEYIQQFGI